MSSQTAAEMFQDYMEGGVRRGVRRGVRHAKRSVSPKRVAPKRVAPKRVAPKRVAPKRNPRSMASLYGGFFESLEGFADAVKDSKKKVVNTEMYAEDKKNPMTPLAKEEVKGGAKKAKKPVNKAKKAVGMGRGRYMSRGGYEEEQSEEQYQEHDEQSEEFMNIKDAVSQVKELIGGYKRAVRRATPKRRVAPKPRTAPKRRVAPKRPATSPRRFYM
jgi:hypothetical protein